LENGANIQCKTNDNQTCLHLASEKVHTDVVKILLEKGANIQSKTNDEDTCLHLAIKHGHIDVVRILAQNKWLISEKDKRDFFPLGLATKSNHIEVVHCLLDLGTELEVLNTYLGNTALHIASENGFFEIAESLIANGANINSKSKAGYSQLFFLYFCIYLGAIQIIRDTLGGRGG
jgi:ankyrin repeat protein